MPQPALFAAIAANDLAAMERAVHHNVHGACETDADSGRSALHEAAALGRAQALVILFRYLRGYPGLDRSGATPLLLALRGGHLDAARSILTHQAACWGVQSGCLDALVATGVDAVDMALEMFRRGLPLRQRAGPVAALAAAEQQGLAQIAALLRLRLDAQTQLLQAVRANDATTLIALCANARVLPNDLDDAGWPALARAIEAGAMAAFDALVDAGAALDHRLPDGTDLLQLALAADQPALARRWVLRCNPGWHDLTETLRQRALPDGDPNLVGRDGLPPLHLLALAEGDTTALAQALLTRGADLLLRHPVWGNAIDFAGTLGRPELADCLTVNRDLARFRWQADARRQGVDYIAIWVDKGMGLRWNPNNPVKPLDVGGDYDGAWPMTPVEAMAELKRCGLFTLLPQRHQALVQKLVDGQDFALDEALALFAPSQVRWRP